MCEIIPTHKKHSPTLENVPFLTQINNEEHFNVKAKTQLVSFWHPRSLNELVAGC